VPFSHHTEERDSETRRFAPTEDCPWRERVIHGEVHDQNAYALGGVAGHAGLFSTCGDIHSIVSELIKCYEGKSDWLENEVVREFIPEGKEKPFGNQFVLGWNRPSRENSASGHFFSPNSIGHLGYTGCSLWIDLTNKFWMILLTNRIHPSTTNQMIASFRPQIHDLAYNELYTTK
jgi:CubicO group peptidase (beta-lactamase class C family)